MTPHRASWRRRLAAVALAFAAAFGASAAPAAAGQVIVFWGPIYDPSWLTNMSGTYEDDFWFDYQGGLPVVRHKPVLRGQINVWLGQCAKGRVEVTHWPSPAYYVKSWSYTSEHCLPVPHTGPDTAPFEMALSQPFEQITQITIAVCRWTPWDPLTCGPAETIYSR
ncbi:hypothetical protein HNP84_001190 [Thermocatellispora tengchongensis]|uniref:Secreted protein n=1 Tax=Thermocatellispora tengchongensis TaxID=1073253 RepID=A0A840NS58_9ACTN|nr:hypothetical protein [Thermocatellispora tengchongensis]MBB5131484.1 hypothetical protein [Thermocatellispora tengchongensis]